MGQGQSDWQLEPRWRFNVFIVISLLICALLGTYQPRWPASGLLSATFPICYETMIVVNLYSASESPAN